MTNQSIEKQNLTTLFTIGHSNHRVGRVIELLTFHNITCVVDVRSTPYSKFHKEFNREEIQAEFRKTEIEYIWMGQTLGGRQEDKVNSAGIRLDALYNDDPKYWAGLASLMKIAFKKRTAIMCSEEDPRKCHRHKIIADSILKRRDAEGQQFGQVKVMHIRGDGSLEDASKIQIAVQIGLPI